MISWRNHMLPSSAMDSFDELPDNFDEAYMLFSQTYAINSENVQVKPGGATPLGTDKLLNDQEQQVFSKFLDKVLEDPNSAADSNEMKWLDQHFALIQPAQSAPEPHSDKGINSDFYRGFREMGDTWRRNMPTVMPGEHPQLAESVSMPAQYPKMGMVGAGGHIVPNIPTKMDQIHKNVNPWTGFEIASAQSPASSFATINQDAAHAAAHAAAHTAPHTAPSRPPQELKGIGHQERRFSAAMALSTAAQAHARVHSPSNQPSPPLQQRYHAQLNEAVVDPHGKRPHSHVVEETQITPPAQPQSLKKKREFLTENQVRLNHINSEKRRRDLISLNFKEMCNLVPTIPDNQNTLPKAVVLQNVYDYLLEIADENQRIRADLTERGIDCGDIPATKLGEKLVETDAS